MLLDYIINDLTGADDRDDAASIEKRCLLKGQLQIKMQSDIPQGAGLGSSAAFAASLAGAVVQGMNYLMDK